MRDQPPPAPTVAVVLKGYPRLSETFIARELLELQQRGLDFMIVSLRRPTTDKRHPWHDAIRAPVLYLPEYLHDEPLRVLRGLASILSLRNGWRALGEWLGDLVHDPTPNRVRRFGQAAVLQRELPASVDRFHIHFLHTPGSVGRYTAIVRALPFSLSAHAKDIWTTSTREKRRKLLAASWTVTCTARNLAHLREIAPAADIELVHHGVDLTLFSRSARRRRGRTILSIARVVPKKGIDTLIDALALLPRDLAWRFVHIGAGFEEAGLARQALRLGLSERIACLGARSQGEVVEALGDADVFCLPCRIDRSGDRDGLPNVVLEAMAAGLPVVTTPVAAVEGVIEDGVSGLLVPPDDPRALARVIERLLRDPTEARRIGGAAQAAALRLPVFAGDIDRLAARFGLAEELRAA